MTLAQLKYVITVAETKSMNEAAKQLFISQPSLSSAIKDLEEEIGVEVFRRSNTYERRTRPFNSKDRIKRVKRAYK